MNQFWQDLRFCVWWYLFGGKRQPPTEQDLKFFTEVEWRNMRDKPYWRLLLPRWIDLRIPRKTQSRERIESNISKLKAMLEEERVGK